MPEGDTVWLAARNLDRALAGNVITDSDFRIPSLATADLTGRTVLEVRPVGKHLLFRFDDGTTLRTHFRMDGSWHLYRPGASWRGGPTHRVRLVLRTADWVAVGYLLHDIELIATTDEASLIGHLGPDILDDDFDASTAVANLLRQPDAEIGMALLDQRNLAGIGNIYRNEGCFLEGTWPWTPVSEVRDLDALVRRCRTLMMRNRERASQATTGDLGARTEHWVYGRAGRGCLRCRARVKSAEQGVAPAARTTFWCPTCQSPGSTSEPGDWAERTRPSGR